ncbi:MAG: cobalamin biosynthesis protein [Methanotrichaceae archaeon]|nr:cobalamin biosynthesis protein [Methanotrichaceae archaeon]
MIALDVFLLAVALDLFLGEPPAAVHPVVLIGRLITALRRRFSPTRLHGAILAASVVLASAVAGHLVVAIAGLAFPGLAIILSAYLLKSTFAIRSLLQTSREIGLAIRDDLGEAKRMLPALVSRDASSLTERQAASAVIESLSENYVDAVLSPIFYYLLFSPLGLGIEASLAFKAMSTMDSMLGYRTPDLRELGWASARLDDLANWIPARISPPIIAAARPLRAIAALRSSFLWHGVTPSPNSGWPMAAAAGALGIRLEKPGAYIINESGGAPGVGDISRALWLLGVAMALAVILAIAVLTEEIYITGQGLAGWFG